MPSARSGGQNTPRLPLQQIFRDRAALRFLIGLDLPPLVLLHLLAVRDPVDAVLRKQLAHDVVDAALHALEAAHVDVGVLFLEEAVQLLRVLGHPGLDVHLVAVLVLLLAGDAVIEAEVIRVEVLHGLELLLVEKGVGGGDAEEEPHGAGEFVVGVVLHEGAAEEGAEGGDAGAGGEHDDGGVRVLGHEHGGADGAGDVELVAGLEVAEEV
mmetsp:Transcript_748/g.2175  ORF Transcript_748/g.2175 Transcript_748/m.2175 type:complete len:211 (-) Transcript_748:126-758(-)